MTKERLLMVTAAALFLGSLAFPFWTARMKAPTYPEKALALHMYAYSYKGDIKEWGLVGRLVGVRVPPPIPDLFFQLFPVAVVVSSILALVSAVNARLLRLAAVFPWLVLLALAAWGQYSLYLFGHNLDPERPLRYFDAFTPPLVGIVTLGKIQVFHIPDLGSILFVSAALLLTVRAIKVWRVSMAPSRVGRIAPALKGS